MNRLSNVVFYVKDVRKTVEFFERAFGLQRQFIDETGQYAQMETGSTSLAFASESLARQNLPQGFTPLNPSSLPPACEIALASTHVHESYAAALKAGAIAVIEPKEKPWGQTCGYVRDPYDGILIEIASEMACLDTP